LHRCATGRRLLEIGVGGYELKTAGGASLAMWADYFPCGLITGIDVMDKRLSLNPRVKVFRGSQDDAGFLRSVCKQRGPFDIIIDDGSHVPKQVVTSFNLLFEALVDGGTYVIEDMQTAFWPQFGGSPLHGGETMKLARLLIDCLNHAEITLVDPSHSFPPFAKQVKALHACHNMLIVHKGDNREPSNLAYNLGNPYAANAVKLIERELAEQPTAEGVANLIEVHVRGANLKRAKQICEDGLKRWPKSAALLMAGYSVAAQSGDTAGKIRHLEGILQIEPDNTALQRLLAQARAESGH
jgi:hypothetical protein